VTVGELVWVISSSDQWLSVEREGCSGAGSVQGAKPQEYHVAQ
jgi:hypothetical protein